MASVKVSTGSSKHREKPLGMRVGESVFCMAYLAFALVAGIVFALHATGEHAGFAATCAVMTLLLGGGDAFHLVPRIVANLRGMTGSRTEERRRTWWLGLGNLVSSITMTIFYVLLFDALRQMPGATGEAPQFLRWLLVALAVARIALCLFPQNHWFDGRGTVQWGVYRNVPFVAMGFITMLYLLVWYHASLMALLVAISFACYMAVVLLAKQRPAMGMFMIPKTICYIWTVVLLLRAI